MTEKDNSKTNESTCKGCKDELKCTPENFALCQGDGYIDGDANEW